jgi:hypothetical protein
LESAHARKTPAMQEQELLVKVIEMEEAIIGIRKDGLGHVYMRSGTDLTVNLQWRMLENYRKITEGKDYKFIFEAGEQVVITNEARANAKNIQAVSPVQAIAAIVNNLGYRLIAEFYYKINKPQKPFKAVCNIEEAVKWLKALEPDREAAVESIPREKNGVQLLKKFL